MSAIETSETIYYHAVFKHGIDAKRRLQIPSKWLPQDGRTQFTLILWPNASLPDANILVLPPAEMDALAAKIKTMPLGDPKALALRRLLGSKSARVDVDSGGRICLPEDMARIIGVTPGNEAVLVGLVDRFEIWNPERYENMKTVDDALLTEAFKLI